MHDKVDVKLGNRSYSIHIGTDLLKSAGDFILPLLRRKKVAIITDSNIAALHLNDLKQSLLSYDIDISVLSLPPGERTKSWEYIEKTVEWLLAEHIERDDLIIAFGGGVIGDLVGFAASILRRGVRFVQIPTSLLAQVDSSVGGKTGINSLNGKNLIGAFNQPQMVLIDINLLDTLSARDFLAGYGEVMKYGLLGDCDFFEWLEDNALDMAKGNTEKRIYAVKRSCEMKADIVSQDEQEKGQRALLNLGHTFCHALETATGLSDRLLHGEGVGIGCALAFETSMRLGLCPQETPSRVRAHLIKMGMKVSLSDIPGTLPNSEELIRLMQQDKKAVDGKIAFIMAKEIGNAFILPDIDLDIVKNVLNDALI
ncbi:3-dehydroquinate synthase [Amylibacter sp.]|nr:3-dehydroquinate synthase [Amylibacter sp.]